MWRSVVVTACVDSIGGCGHVRCLALAPRQHVRHLQPAPGCTALGPFPIPTSVWARATRRHLLSRSLSVVQLLLRPLCFVFVSSLFSCFFACGSFRLFFCLRVFAIRVVDCGWVLPLSLGVGLLSVLACCGLPSLSCARGFRTFSAFCRCLSCSLSFGRLALVAASRRCFLGFCGGCVRYSRPCVAYFRGFSRFGFHSFFRWFRLRIPSRPPPPVRVSGLRFDCPFLLLPRLSPFPSPGPSAWAPTFLAALDAPLLGALFVAWVDCSPCAFPSVRC